MVQIKLSVVFILAAAAIASVQVVALPFPAKDQDSSKSSKTIQATSTLPPHNELPQQTGQPETPPSSPNTNPRKRKQTPDQPGTPPLEKDQVKVPPQKKQKHGADRSQAGPSGSSTASGSVQKPLTPLFTTKPLVAGSGKGISKQGDATITSNTGSHSAPGGSSTASGSMQARPQEDLSRHSAPAGLSTASESSSTQAHPYLGKTYTGASDTLASHWPGDPYYWPGQEENIIINTVPGSPKASGSTQAHPQP